MVYKIIIVFRETELRLYDDMDTTKEYMAKNPKQKIGNDAEIRGEL